LNKAEKIGKEILKVCDPVIFEVKSITPHPTKKLSYEICCEIIGTIRSNKEA